MEQITCSHFTFKKKKKRVKSILEIDLCASDKASISLYNIPL